MTYVSPATTYNPDEFERITTSMLTPIVRKIDEERIFPEEIVRAYARSGAYGTHVGGPGSAVDLTTAILSLARASEECLSTGFCLWQQDTIGWYIASSENDDLKRELLPRIVRGEVLGGTGMSNPMKAMSGIEGMRLKGTRVDGGYVVKGLLPWVSNLIQGGYFGTLFEVEASDGPRRVMTLIGTDWEGVKITLDHDFVAMGGTATCSVQIRDAFVPDKYILGDPAGDFLRRMRPGFTLLQCGMAAGIIKNCIDLMKQVQGSLGHVNKYLAKQPEDIEREYAAIVGDVLEMAKTPYDTSDAFYRRVLEARLKGGELAVDAAHWAQLHCGARGYVTHGAAQRRLREAYFIAIVTPATKHLRKMIAELDKTMGA